MNWLRRLPWVVCAFSLVGTVVLLNHALRARPEQATPQELYAVVQRHLLACRSADFPLAYHAAASTVQENLSLVQYERKIRQDYQPVAGAQHVEYGAVHHPRNDARRAIVDVYFIAGGGEVTGWTYMLVFEDGDWKVDHGEQIPGWPAGQRLGGSRI